MRICDWSSDVFASDLPKLPKLPPPTAATRSPFSRPNNSCFRAPSPSYAFTSAKDRFRQDRTFTGTDWNNRRWVGCCHRHSRGRTSAFRSEEHTSELQSLMRISYAVFCLKKKTHN